MTTIEAYAKVQEGNAVTYRFPITRWTDKFETLGDWKIIDGVLYLLIQTRETKSQPEEISFWQSVKIWWLGQEIPMKEINRTYKQWVDENNFRVIHHNKCGE